MLISVIIPAFNVEHTLERAIKSVLIQSEVSEIVIVEDGSTDNTLQLAIEWQRRDNRIKLCRHQNNTNKGASASRNLGVLNAKNKIIAFLDADDQYYKDRFKETIKQLSRKGIDGVYDPVESEDSQIINEIPVGMEVFDAVLDGKGWIHLNGLTVYKDKFVQVGGFNEDLIIVQDTEFLIKYSVVYKLTSGSKRPVANRYPNEKSLTVVKKKSWENDYAEMWKALLHWALIAKVDIDKLKKIVNKLIIHNVNSRHGFFRIKLELLKIFLSYPKLFLRYISR